jgi:hydrogenase large subunit
MSRRILGPFNRVEGDLNITLDFADGKVSAARVTAPLFRGFERILLGREPLDALAIVPRICGICSVSQSVAAANALSALYGITPPPNGLHVRNLIHAVENVADHLSHFYLFFMPDFARADYQSQPWHTDTFARFQAQRGTAVAPMLEARAILMRFMGSLAGHWPHTLCLQPGGVTKVVSAAERVRLQQWLRSFRRYLEQHTFGLPLEAIAALDSPAALTHYREQAPKADFACFLHIADSLQLQRLGRSYDRFIAAAAYAGPDGSWSPAGVWQAGSSQPLALDDISEDNHSSWLAGDGPSTPLHTDTVPLPDKAAGYSWSKAPRLAGAAAETGALARGLLRGETLLEQLVQQAGGNVLSRVVARLTEVARIVPLMEQWLVALQLEQAFQLPAPAMPQQGQAIGLTEAARGMLGHWVALDAGRISRYQIIAPTTWNFSPRDSQGQPGPLEKALEGVDASDPQALQVQHIVRSFDPCQVCTTH